MKLATPRHPMVRIAPIVIVGLLLVACQTTTGALIGGTTADNGARSYNIFFDQADHLEELVAAERWDEAADLYEDENAFFSKNRDDAELKADLTIVAKAIDGNREPHRQKALASLTALSWPVDRRRWSDVREMLDQARSEVAADKDAEVLAVLGTPLPSGPELAEAFKAAEYRIKQNAPAELASYPLTNGTGFFDAYPIDLDRKATLDAALPNLRATFAGMSPTEVASFRAHYGEHLSDAAKTQFSDAAFASLLKAQTAGREPTLEHILAAFQKAKAQDLAPKKLSEPVVRFVEVTSRTLLREGQVEFPAAVDVDMPVEVQKQPLDQALAHTASKGLDYLIVFDVAVARTTRRVASKERVPSQYQSSTRSETNPAYLPAQMALQQAQSNLQTVKIQAATGCIGCGLVPALIHAAMAAAAEDEANKKIQAAMSRLSTTPPMVDKPVYSDYNFDRAHVDASKALSVNYYVIDFRKRVYYKSFLTVSEKKPFTVAYKLHDRDRNRSSHLSNADSEETVAAFEKAPVSVKLSEILQHYASQKKQAQPLPSIAVLRSEMLKDKNTALAKYKDNTFDARPLNDSRFDSVVVVYNPEGGVGSGFFVKPDLVLTNYHVVDGVKFVEMKLYDGSETFGKVVKSDIRLDLALVRVQTRGKPVRFYSGNTVDLGVTAEAIGHPNGLNYSVTRGVISALRPLESQNAPGGKEILFIQTDAAINPGNSGGPLFIEDRVVGVNTQKLARVDVEGIGFAIHFSEVSRFLSEDFGS